MISTHRAALRRTIASTAGRSDSFSSSLGRNLLVRSTRLSIKANRVFISATIGPTSSPHIKNKPRHQAQRSRPRACPVVQTLWQEGRASESDFAMPAATSGDAAGGGAENASAAPGAARQKCLSIFAAVRGDAGDIENAPDGLPYSARV